MVSADFSQGLLLLGGFRADGGLRMIAQWSFPTVPLELTWAFTSEAVRAENTFKRGYHAYPWWKQSLYFSICTIE